MTEVNRELTVPAGWLHRSWRLPLLALLVPGVCAYLAEDDMLAALACGGLVAGAVLAVVSVARNSWPRAVPVTLRVTADSLVIGDSPPLALDTIAEARTVTGESGRPEVVLTLRRDGEHHLRGGELRLRLAPEHVAPLLASLGVGAGVRRATFPLMLAFRYRLAATTAIGVIWMLMLAVATSSTSITVTPPPLPSSLLDDAIVALSILVFVILPTAAVAAWVAGLLWRGQAVIGADGLTLVWPFVRPRFLSFRDITSVEGVVPWYDRQSLITKVSLRSGHALQLLAREAPTSQAQVGAESRALYQHLADALDRSLDRNTSQTQLEDLLARRHHSVRDWLASLDTIGREGGARYREDAPTTERLLGALQDPALHASSRTAAAVALLRRGDDESRRAVRVVTDSCAQPDLRRALLDLEQAADDDAFADVLASVEPPVRRRAP